jgi:hypothetical protein
MTGSFTPDEALPSSLTLVSGLVGVSSGTVGAGVGSVGVTTMAGEVVLSSGNASFEASVIASVPIGSLVK